MLLKDKHDFVSSIAVASNFFGCLKLLDDARDNEVRSVRYSQIQAQNSNDSCSQSVFDGNVAFCICEKICIAQLLYRDGGR